jgi:hypothetical protein
VSWDIFVYSSSVIPPKLADMPEDWQWEQMGSLDDLRNKLSDIAADIDWSDPSWGQLDRGGFSMELNIGSDDPCMDFALHVRGGADAIIVIKSMIERYGWYAIDSSQGEWMHHAPDLESGLERFNQYKNKVVTEAVENRKSSFWDRLKVSIGL